MIERQIDSPMPRRLSRTNEIRAFWGKIGNSIAASAGVWTRFLDRSCSRPTSARIRRGLLAGSHHGPGDLHSHAADAGQLGQWAPWHRRRSVIRVRMAPWANRPGIKEPHDEDEILSAMLLLVPALAIAVVIFCTYLAVPLPSWHAIPVRIPIGELSGYENRKLVQHSADRLPNHSALTSREMGRKRQILRPPYNSSDPFRYRILTYVQLSHQSQSFQSRC